MVADHKFSTGFRLEFGLSRQICNHVVRYERLPASNLKDQGLFIGWLVQGKYKSNSWCACQVLDGNDCTCLWLQFSVKTTTIWDFFYLKSLYSSVKRLFSSHCLYVLYCLINRYMKKCSTRDNKHILSIRILKESF